ncbi:MAG: tripartite tricarboxylate transporter substrate binding protein [Xanthobacteraceae bacterium]
MDLSRRTFVQSAAVAAVALPRLALADDYPVRPVRFVVGFVAGGAPDIIARLIGQSLSERLGQPFVVEDRPGAGTNIATETVIRTAPDGYTILLAGTPNMINASLYSDLKFDFIRDITPVGSFGENPFVMVVSPEFPAKTIGEFIAYAKANPGKINVTSTGTGNLTYFSAEYFKMLTGVQMVQVPAHGEMEAQTDLMAGRVHVMFDPIVSCIGYIRNGKLRALGVTTAKRLDALPGVPAIAETVPGYDVAGWLGVGAPKDTPPGIIDELNAAIAAALAEPAVRAHLDALGFLPAAMPAADFRNFIANETDKWAKVIKFSNLKPI